MTVNGDGDGNDDGGCLWGYDDFSGAVAYAGKDDAFYLGAGADGWGADYPSFVGDHEVFGVDRVARTCAVLKDSPQHKGACCKCATTTAA